MGIKVIRGKANNYKLKSLVNFYPVVAIGKFDGVHLGHQALLDEVREISKNKENSKKILFSFFPYPESFFLKKKFSLSFFRKPLELMPVGEKIRYLRECKFDYFYLAKFNSQFLKLSCREFFVNYLVNALFVKHIVVGEDWRFGRDRAGDIETLKLLCNEYGVKLSVVKSVLVDNKRVSSKNVRELIKEGRVKKACSLLGRPYSLSGIVKHGDHRGRELGFRTANLCNLRKLPPKNGVYVCRLKIAGKGEFFDAVTNVGIRPTFGDKKLIIEAHILGKKDIDVYFKEITLYFIDRIRDEVKFNSKKDLISSIKKDIELAKDILEKNA